MSYSPFPKKMRLGMAIGIKIGILNDYDRSRFEQLI